MKKKGIIATLLALMMLLTASPAQADVIGGGGTAPAGGSLEAGGFAPANWDRVVGVWDPTGAWDDFLAGAQGNGNHPFLNTTQRVIDEVRYVGGGGTAGQNLVDKCSASRLIVWLRDENYGLWMSRTTGFGIRSEVQHGNGSGWTSTQGYGYVYIEQRNTAGQPGYDTPWRTSSGQLISPKQEVLNYAASAPSATTLICAWGSDVASIEESYSRSQAVVNDSESWTAPYTWSTSVQREITVGGIDPIGVNNLHDQPAVTAKSNFGNVYDTLRSSSAETETIQQKRARINNALAADASADHPDLVLSNQNQAGLAEGGVLSVYEHTSYATINSSQSTVWSRCNLDSRTRSWNGHAYVTTVTASGPTPWVPACNSAPLVGAVPTFQATNPSAPGYPTTAGHWRAGTTSFTNSKTLGTAQNTGFWQILSVHCNPEEFAQLLAAVSGETVVSQTAGVDGNTTAVVYSRHYDGRPARVDFGQDTGDGSILSRTGQLGFYDKECGVQCVALPQTSNGASSSNGATSNVTTTTNVNGKDYYGGAVLENEVNSNYFEIFRDNADRRVNVNVWYPRNNDPQLKYGGTYPNLATGSGTVTIPASAPVSTTITRWAQGTPTTAANSGGKFTMEAINSGGTRVPIFTGASAATSPQTNWSVNTHNTLNSVTLNGLYRSFNVKSTWASENGRPQVVNVSWEYRPTVWTRIPSRIGFDSTGTLEVTSHVVRDQAVDVKCIAEYGRTTQSVDTRTIAQNHTGTGTIDPGFMQTTNGDNSYRTSTNLVFKFLRAVSE